MTGRGKGGKFMDKRNRYSAEIVLPCKDIELPLPPQAPPSAENRIILAVKENDPSGRPPLVIVQGSDNVSSLMAREYKDVDMCLPYATRAMMGPKALTETTGEEHKKLKEGILKGVTPGRLSEYTPSICEHTSFHVDKWVQSGGPNMKTYIGAQSLVADVMLDLVIGVRPDNPRHSELKEAVNTAAAALISIPGSDAFDKGLAAVGVLTKYVEGTFESAGGSPDHPNMMTNLIDASRELNGGTVDVERVAQNAIGLILTASLSPCGVMANLTYHLGTNPETLDNVRDELKTHGLFGPGEHKELTFDLVQKLDYVNAAVKECLRLIPTVGMCIRKTNQDIEFGGYRIPKDYGVYYSTLGTHAETNSRLPKGDKFLPDRWLHQNVEKEASSACPESMTVKKLLEKDNTHYFPFCAQKRTCVNKDLAEVMLAVFVVKLASTADWEITTPGLPLDRIPVAVPKDLVEATFRNI